MLRTAVARLSAGVIANKLMYFRSSVLRHTWGKWRRVFTAAATSLTPLLCRIGHVLSWTTADADTWRVVRVRWRRLQSSRQTPSITPSLPSSLFHSRLKTFPVNPNPSHRSLFSASSWPTPRTPWAVYRYFWAYTFLFIIFFILFFGSVRWTKLTYVSCRAHDKIARRVVSYRICSTVDSEVFVADIGNESVPIIIINNTINLFLDYNQHFGNFKL